MATDTLKHTPGPWTVWKYGNIIMSDNLPPNDWTVAEASGETHEAAKANARLIAAAPDLLEACEFLVAAKADVESRGDVFHPEPVVMRRINEAIAKARGE